MEATIIAWGPAVAIFAGTGVVVQYILPFFKAANDNAAESAPHENCSADWDMTGPDLD
jgi:hypothetical protein